MSAEIAITLFLLLAALILFALEKIPVDIIGIILVIGLIMSGVLTVPEGLSGFSDNVIIIIGALFVLTGGLIKTGLVDLIGRRLYRISGDNEFVLTALIMAVAAISASVLKNTTTTAMFLPVVLGLAARAKIPPSRLLMPLAFGAILGGSCTLIGTSTNLAVSSALSRYASDPNLTEQVTQQLQPFSMFELTPVGAIAFLFGMAYMLFLGRKWLPRRGGGDSFTEQYNIREYISEVVVLQGSHLIGKTLGEADISRELDLNVLGIIRGKEERIAPSPRERIAMNDLLIVEGKAADILNIKAEAGLDIKADFTLNDRVLEGGEVQLFEIMVMRDSRLVGQTLKTVRFRQKFDLTVLAINRHGENFLDKMSSVPLKFGDVLLVQGNLESIETFVTDGELMILEDVSQGTMRTEKRRWAITAFVLFLALSLSKLATGYEIPLVVAVLISVLLLLATKTVLYRELYSLIDFRLLVLIACMMSFGIAMEKTGTDKYLANLIVLYFEQYGSIAVLAGFFLLTVALTQPMSNQAAALVVLPVAVKTALVLGLNPRTFAIAITYAASFSFITPLEPACVLVYTPGRYRFMDFVKIGTFLTIVVFIVAIVLVPIFWEF